MQTHDKDNRTAGGDSTNRDHIERSGPVGSEVRSDSGREEVSRGRHGRRCGGSLHLGLRGVDQVTESNQVNYWKVLDEIREALVEINQTLKMKL